MFIYFRSYLVSKQTTRLEEKNENYAEKMCLQHIFFRLNAS